MEITGRNLRGVSEYINFRTFYLQNIIPMVRRLLCDESSNPYPLMLCYFIETRCHSIFFEIGDKLLEGRHYVNVYRLTNPFRRESQLHRRSSSLLDRHFDVSS